MCESRGPGQQRQAGGLKQRGPSSVAPSTRDDGKHPVAADPQVAEAAAVARCAAGDGTALEMLYQQHARSCLRLARSVLVDGHHAEDAVQEAYLELWCHADRFDSSRSSVRGWLLMLTHRKAVDRVRREQRRSTVMLVPEHDVSDEGPSTEMQAVSQVLGRQAVEALAALEPVKREALVLAYWGGYTQREIAVLTSTPIGTVKSRMHAAMKDLARLLPQDVPASSQATRQAAASIS